VSSTHSCIEYFFPTRISKVGVIFFKLARLYLAFFFSSVIHMGGDRMLSGKMSFGSFKFFMLQAVGITIEVFVCFLWRCLRKENRGEPDFTREKRSISTKSASYRSENLPPMWTRCVGFTWFALWSIWTGAFMMDAMCSQVMTKPQLDLRRLHWKLW